VNILFIASKIDLSFRSLPGLDGSRWSKGSSLHSRAIRSRNGCLFSSGSVLASKTTGEKDNPAFPIRTKPHLPERASKLQDISTEFFQGHRPCFAFIMARSEMPSPKGFMNRRSNAFSHVFLYGRPGRLRKPEMRACVRFLAKEGGNRCLCSARHLFLVGVYRRCFNCQPSEAQDAQQSGLSSKEGQHFV
jgi:hypothetical protein